MLLIKYIDYLPLIPQPINYPKETTKLASINSKATVAPKKTNTVVKKQPASKKASKTVTPKKYRKNFVIRIPRTIFKSDGPKRITITRTTPPATIEYEIPTHTNAEETTTYYSTFGYDFISPSPKLSKVYRTRKTPLTKNKVPVTNASNSQGTVPVTKASNNSVTTPVTKISKQTETVPVTKAP
ncbi:hypothetical protein PIROE2DRAFT_62182 [Piromyces sp. E2]|nr:hypothetical protein PIROE2DRAFT_62182 [Piromyces sp. E2]|eukprot:OUM61984.1 hypothetical protein PIROE2DRAFT_62182 [Piromyces sp. E2]